jgi:formimidoylglutamate deiminase
VNLFFQQARLPDGWARDVRVTVTDGQVGAVETGASADGAERVSGAAVPAMTNLHSHAFQRAMAGLAERGGAGVDDFWAWRKAMYGFLGKLTPDQVEAIAAQLQVELLEQGYAGICEFHYLHNAPGGGPYDDPAELAWAIRRAAEATGIGLTLTPVLYTSSGFGGTAPVDGQKRFITAVDDFLRLIETTRAEALSFHSLRAVTPEQMAMVLAAVPRTMPIHVHAAEQTGEVEACLAWSGERPVEWLLNHQDLSSRWALVHATHMTDDEATRLARSGATAVLCPSTEGNLGDGFFNAAPYLAADGRFGIGTDSHVSTSPTEELRWFEYGRRLQARRRTLGGEEGGHVGAWLWTQAAAAGSGPAGRKVGEIAVGARADFVILDPDHPILVGRQGDLILDSFVFSGQGAVREVWAGGKRLVQDGRHLARDRIAAQYRQAIHALQD